MIKKLTVILLCFAMAFSAAAFAFDDVSAESEYADAIKSLSELGVITGYPDGSFRANEPLTRAQFAKIVVKMTGNEEAALTKMTEVFTDVPSTHWAIGYINEAAELGIITGYPDGSFAPEEEISYAQAITITVRMLGYSAAEVGTNWPSDYINKAYELGLIKNLKFTNSQILNRESAAYILNNSLSAKEGTGNPVNSLKKVEDIIVYGVNKNNSAVGINEVVTSGGTYKKGVVDIEDYLGKKVTVRINTDNEITMVTEGENNAKTYTVTGAYSDKVLTSEAGYVSVDGNMTVYYKGAKSNYQAVYSTLVTGSRMYVYDDYIYIDENRLEGPYTITAEGSQIYNYFEIEGTPEITIDGEQATVDEIERYDVVYYNSATNRIYVYTDRVTGIYEKASPSKDNLSSITLSGTVYSNIGPTAKEKLDDTLGAFKLNDRVTLLFGNDGSVVDAVDINGKTLSDMGAVIKSYSEISKDADTLGKNEYYTQVMLATGKTVSLKTDKDYSDKENVTYTGKFVYITYNGNGEASLQLATENSFAGDFDKSVPSFGGCDFRANYSILERVYTEKYHEAVVRKINLSDISLKSLKQSQVIHVEYANAMNDIAVLYVENVTYSGYTFGILNEASHDTEANYTYELKSSSGTTRYTGSAGWSYAKGEAVMVMADNGKIKAIKSLTEIQDGTEIQGYTDNKIMMKDKTYRMDEEVTVVYKTIAKSGWNVTTLDDLTESINDGSFEVNKITLYADAKGDDARVRVIKVTLK